MALEVDTDEALAEQKGLYEELGYTDCSEIKDRNYFHSIYCRSPGGILTDARPPPRVDLRATKRGKNSG